MRYSFKECVGCVKRHVGCQCECPAYARNKKACEEERALRNKAKTKLRICAPTHDYYR